MGEPKIAMETYAGKVLTADDCSDVSSRPRTPRLILFRPKSGAPGSLVVKQVSAGRKNRLYLELD